MLVASALIVLVASRRAWSRSPIAACLLTSAAIALVGTMALAAMFATTSSAGRGSTLSGAVSIDQMLAYHGAGNALGFALAAMVALTLLDARSDQDAARSSRGERTA
jgi:hypothetical protein